MSLTSGLHNSRKLHTCALKSFARFSLSFVLIAALTVIVAQASAQSISNHDNVVAATLDGDTLFASSGNMMCLIDAQGGITFPDGSSGGQLNAQHDVVDVNGDKIGEVTNNGKVYDSNGDFIGQVNNNGTITDINDDVIGYHSNIDKRVAAWYQFFSPFNMDF